MSPRAKHIPDTARPTTIRLTDEELAAINWIRMARRQKGDDRKTINDVIVDALWCLLKTEAGKTIDDVRATIPARPEITLPANVAEMPKPKRS